MSFVWKSSWDNSPGPSSERTFPTQRECYEDMMIHAVDKMKWNLEYDDVLDDPISLRKTEDGLETTDTPINYTLNVNSDRIVHKSYSGTYEYWIEKIP